MRRHREFFLEHLSHHHEPFLRRIGHRHPPRGGGRFGGGGPFGGDDDMGDFRGGDGAGRIGRMFGHGDLRLLLLALIEKEARHGYELIRLIEEMSGGAYTPSPGAIYPTLTLLEEAGHAEVANAGSN